MKTLIFIFFGISLNTLISAQIPTCKSLHEGSFKVTTKESGITFIKRTKTHQIEENSSLGYKIVLDIIWIDDCTYELRPKQLIKGDPAIMGDGKNVLKSRIKSITKKAYTVETSANFSDDVVDFDVEILTKTSAND
jgi:hypothetical protein